MLTGRRHDDFDHTVPMPDDPISQARDLFLTEDNAHGCAEATYITLKTAYGLPDAEDSSAAMALNGGVAYSGGVCGAISGAALAVGQLAGRRIADHNEAKTKTREMMMEVMDEFDSEFGATSCRDLLGLDLRKPGEHDRFIESGIWQTNCMQQIEFAVRRLADLDEQADWGSNAPAG